MASSLGETLKRGVDFHRAWQLDQALAWYRAALAIDPDDADANSLVGLALVHSGRAAEATPFLLRAVELEPSQAGFRHNLAEGLEATGAYDRALTQLGAILAQDPARPQIWEKAGDIASLQKDDTGAAAAWDRARMLDPAALTPALKLAGLELARSRFDAAISVLNPIAERAAQHESIFTLWCQALVGLRDWQALRATATSWTGAHPASRDAWRNLARGAFEQGRHREAVDAFGKVLTLGSPGAIDLTTYAGLCLHVLDFAAAEGALSQAEAIDPQYAEMLSIMALVRLYRGRFAEAEDYCRRCLAAAPEYVPAYSILSRLQQGRLSDADLGAVTRLTDRQESSLDRRIPAAFVVAHARDARGDIDAAFAAYTHAHALALERDGLERRSYDRAQEEARERRLIELFPAPSGDASRQSAGPRPIFIVGMPRSGTTLIESVLGAHSRVFACGERPAMRQILRAFFKLDAAGVVPDDRILGEWARTYLNGLPALGGADQVTDKQPLNFEAVGLILHLFPGAVIVHVRRDPVETCLSVYRQDFNRLWTFAHRLADIGHYYGRYARLATHWERTFPGRFMTIQYEDFVRDFAHAAPTLVETCGLAWEPQCLEFQRSPRAIATLSSVQARGPVVPGNGRAARYAPYLGELITALDQCRVADSRKWGHS